MNFTTFVKDKALQHLDSDGIKLWNSSYHSWEHCYEVFHRYRNEKKIS